MLPIEVVSSAGRRSLNLTVADLTIVPVPESAPMSVRSLDGLTLGVMLPGFKTFGIVQGARVLGIGTGDISKSGLKPDDVITKIDMSAIRSPQDVLDAAEMKMGRYRLEVVRDTQRLWIWAGAGN